MTCKNKGGYLYTIKVYLNMICYHKVNDHILKIYIGLCCLIDALL